MTSHDITIIEAPEGLNVPGLASRDLIFSRFRDALDPFLVVSLFDMTGPVFPPHPHAGFSVATYIFPESPIGFWNQDTLGTVNEIAPGSLHLTVAGSGVMHEETVTRTGLSARGFQIWIDHPNAAREVTPQALHLAASDVPVEARDGVTRRVLLGASAGLSSPLDPPAGVRLVDLAVEAGADFVEELAEGETGFFWVRDGAVEIAGRPVAAGSVAFVPGGRVALSAGKPARLTLFAGRPLAQSIRPSGPFVASDDAQAQAFRGRFGRGEMGRLTPFDQAALDRAFDERQAAGRATGR